DKVLNEAAEKLQELKFSLVNAVDKDTRYFKAYMDACRLPQKTEVQRKARRQAMQDGLKAAAALPLETAQWSLQTLKIAETVAQHGNPNTITDAAVGAQVAFAGIKGGLYNARINLKNIADETFINQMKQQCIDLEKQAHSALKAIEKILDQKIN
ncbi:MAG: formiminotransferase-cyclodeaminase, partial [Phycisphaerae bacterium SM23_30]